VQRGTRVGESDRFHARDDNAFHEPSEIASCASCAAMTYQMKIQPCAFWMEAIVDHLEAHRFLL
jgi:hypothetical protein